jgi:hypothetical protein
MIINNSSARPGITFFILFPPFSGEPAGLRPKTQKTAPSALRLTGSGFLLHQMAPLAATILPSKPAHKAPNLQYHFMRLINKRGQQGN